MERILNAVRVLSSEDGHSGQIVLPARGFLMRDLQDQGYHHLVLDRNDVSTSLVSINPRKNASGATQPFDFKVHGGGVIKLPAHCGSWLGNKWRANFQGRGWVYVDVVRGHSQGRPLRVMLPTEDQLARAAENLWTFRRDTARYPEFI